jgi:hypothetical protein
MGENRPIWSPGSPVTRVLVLACDVVVSVSGSTLSMSELSDSWSRFYESVSAITYQESILGSILSL